MLQFTADDYADALRSIRKPRGRQTKFLARHAAMPGRAATMSRLAEHVEYASYRPVNLHYGKLAVAVGLALGVRDPGFDVLVDGARPTSISNAEWVLVMRPEFAEGLRLAGCI